MYFEEELQTIKDNDILENTKKVLEQVNENFFIAAASSTGKYHPQYALGEGGLYRHTCAAVKLANCLFELKLNDEFDSTTKDYIRAALILHDTCKSGKNWESKYTVHEHPLLAGELIKDVLGECQYTKIVSELIASHMGQWNTCKYSRIVLPTPCTREEKFVHICDYLASRKFIEILFLRNFNI